MTSLSLALLILAETFTTTSGKFLRVEEPNIPPNATLMSLGFSGVDPSIPGDTKVMMVERLEGQGRVAWIDEWKEAWLDERFMKKREADEVRVEAWQKTWLIGQRRKASSRSAKSRKPMDIGVINVWLLWHNLGNAFQNFYSFQVRTIKIVDLEFIFVFCGLRSIEIKP